MNRPILAPNRIAQLAALGAFLKENLIGQDEVLGEITGLLQRSLCGLKYPNRPEASMLLLGGTGVGKTESVNLFSTHLFGTERLIRLDMSQFQVQESIRILLGGSLNERGILGLYVDRCGLYGTLLLDEIEKAHPLILDLLLQILSAARVTLANGETLDLSGYVVVATSNLGSHVLRDSRTHDRETLVKRALQAAQDGMRPEIYRRFTLKAVFNKLGHDALQKIGDLVVEKVEKLYDAQGHFVRCNRGTVAHVKQRGYSEHYGAGPMEDAAMEILGDVVKDAMFANGGYPVKGTVVFDPKTKQCHLEDAK
jgi:ATP-dependent Clp protease ATP-binding subunit ClpA